MSSRLEKRLSEQRETQKKRMKAIGIIILFLLMLSAAAVSYYLFTNAFIPPKKSRGFKNNALPSVSMFSTASNKVNILVLGVDERSDDVGRSDTIFVATVDTNTKAVSLLSIPRDTRVKIPRHGWDKINHAYALGGSALTQKTVEELLGIPIDYYAAINFSGFYNVVDAIGGVTIDVEKRMYYEDPYDDLVIDFQPGIQRMDGHAAIKYVRYRDEEGDIGRIGRQQKFLRAMVDEVTSPVIIFRIPAIIREVNTAIQTDLSVPEMLNLAKLLNDAKKQGLKVDMLPGQPAYISSVSYWLPDIVSLREYVAENQGLKLDEKYLATAQQMQAEYERSVPTEMKRAKIPKPSQPAQSLLPPKPNPIAKPSADDESPPTPGKSSPPAAPKPAPAKESGRIRAEVLNASGSANAGSKVAAILREQGFEVARISNTTVANRNTLVIANTTDSAVISRLTGLPFKYILQVAPNDTRTSQVTVVVGKDFSN